MPASKTPKFPIRLIRAVKQRWRDRQPLNIRAVKRDAPGLMADAFALRPFVGWRGLLEAADITYDRINIELEDLIECGLCGYEARSLVFHIHRHHEWTAADYREEFPGAPILSEAARAAMTRLDRVPPSGGPH